MCQDYWKNTSQDYASHHIWAFTLGIKISPLLSSCPWKQIQWSHADLWCRSPTPDLMNERSPTGTCAEACISALFERYHNFWNYLVFFNAAMARQQNQNRWHLLECCTFSPGVVAVVLGDAAVVWIVKTLPFVGTPLGTEVVVCIFVVLFPGMGLTVGNTSEEWGWTKASSGCPGFSVFPVAVKPCTTGLENVASTEGSGADVPVWICKAKSCLSLTECWTSVLFLLCSLHFFS